VGDFLLPKKPSERPLRGLARKHLAVHHCTKINLQNFITMVTITGYEPREKDGKVFYAITIQGEARMAQSEESGNFYLTADKTTVSTSFNEAMCQMLVGKQIAGSIQKMECEPYTYTNKQTGELVTLTHRFQYSPKEATNVVQEATPAMQVTMQPQPQINPFMVANNFGGEMAAA
jgi:hypothetical protein